MLNRSHACLQKPSRNVPLILVVDDSEDNILFACGSLEILNLQYLVAKDGVTAIDISMDKLPDVILLDVVMPKMDGIAVMNALKRHHLTNHIPIIAVTGLALPQQKEIVIKGGCDSYLCKPYLIEELQQKLSLFLDLKEVNAYISSR